MSSEPIGRRKLAAILMADVVEYGRHMGENETATIRTLKARRVVFSKHIQLRSGRVVDAKGDAIMAEFSSVVDAVVAAVEIQRQIETDNEALPGEQKMKFRIGINLGDVVEESDSIYGDGVNVAARLETLSHPDGVVISRTVHDSVLGKLPLEFEHLGEHKVKTQTVSAYRVVVPDGAEMPEAAGTTMAPPLPTQPSIAVLPFENMSGDPEQDYFADGIAEDIITDLSRHERLLVIARNSSFAFSGKRVDLRQVGKGLGVRHILEGSVRRAGNRVRITAQLIEADTGQHAWAERYDRPVDDIFAVQDEISRKIVNELNVKVLSGEQAREWQPSNGDIAAYELFLRGHNARMRYTKEDYALARQMCLQAIEIDPEYSAALADVAAAHMVERMSGWVESEEESAGEVIGMARRAVAANESNAYAQSVLGLVLYRAAQYDCGIKHTNQAVELNPQSAFSLQILALLRGLSGIQNAEDLIEKAKRLDPFPHVAIPFTVGVVRWGTGRFDEAIQSFQEVIARTPEHIANQAFLTATLVESGQIEEARERALEVRRLFPNVDVVGSVQAVGDPVLKARLVTALNQVGLS